MKRILLFLLIAVMTLTLFACNDDKGGNTFTGSFQGSDAELVLNGSTATLHITDTMEMDEESLAYYELEGTVTRTSTSEIEFSASTKGDTVTLTAEPVVVKGKVVHSGSAAEAYIEWMKKSYEEMYNTERIDEETYQQQLDLLDGKTVTQSQDMKYVFVAILDRKNGTMRFDTATAYNPDGTVKFQSKYDYDGTTLVRETYMEDTTKRVTEYYPSGEEKSSSRFEDGLPASFTEYYENGEIKSSTRYEDGKPDTFAEYYENGEMKHWVSYDEDGNIESETHYDENGDPIE